MSTTNGKCIQLCIYFGSLILMSSCNELSSNTNQNETVLQPISDDNSIVHVLKIAYSEATFEQVSAQVGECQGNKLCVHICHLPPGDPQNSKDMILPLKASLAHLEHGGPNLEKDYLGPCDQNNPDPIDDNSDDSTDAEGGSSSDSSDAADTVTDIPLWCERYYDLDNNCDGYVDESGEPLF